MVVFLLMNEKPSPDLPEENEASKDFVVSLESTTKIPLPKEQQGFYHRLRGKMVHWMETKSGKQHAWAKYLLLAPDFFYLICRLVVDPDVPASAKFKLAGAIAYFISPLDVFPEFLMGPVGYLDDISLAAFIVNGLLNEVNPAVLRRHWPGEGDVLEHIQSISGAADKMVGSGLWRKVLTFFEAKHPPGR
jgi:uncharacterized membrane protein YkvA (DUF1232 family)